MSAADAPRSPRDMKRDDLRQLWNRESHEYVNRGSALADFPLPQEFLPRPGEKALDAGCGAGNYMGMYRQITRTVFGLDFSDAMTKAAGRYGNTVQGDIQRIPFKGGAFEYVSSHVVINHVPDNRAALTELARVTKPGGRLVVVVPNRLSFLALLRTVMIRLGKYTLGPCRHYSVRSLRREGSEHELSLVRACTVPKVPTAPSLLRYIPSWLGYRMDQIAHCVYPLWGGDLAVLFQKMHR